MLINHGIGRNAHRCHIDGTLTRAASRLYRRSQIQRQFWTCAERGKQGYKNKKRVATKETLLSGKVRHVGRRGGRIGPGGLTCRARRGHTARQLFQAATRHATKLRKRNSLGNSSHGAQATPTSQAKLDGRTALCHARLPSYRDQCERTA